MVNAFQTVIPIPEISVVFVEILVCSPCFSEDVLRVCITTKEVVDKILEAIVNMTFTICFSELI